MGFFDTDRWNEIWFPVKEIGGMVDVSPLGVMNVESGNGKLEIGINAMTVNKAYQQLKSEGYIRTDRRNGARVCELEGENNKLNRDQLRILSQLIAEVKVMGISEEVFFQTCEQLFEGEK